MRKVLLTILCCLLVAAAAAQTRTFTTFIYNDDSISSEIQAYCNDFYPSVVRGTRGGELASLMKEAAINAAKGIGAGYVSAFIDLGVQTVASIVDRRERIRREWENTVASENTYLTHVSSISDLKDFYSVPSIYGPMDPKGMRFNGIGCLRKNGDDTVFYISMHINRQKINRIVEHSKFELVLDTLIISPYFSNLPNSSFDTAFSYEQRQNYTMNIDFTLSSSWMTQATMIQDNVELGRFSICIPVRPNNLDSNGFLRYVRHGDAEPRYPVMGESFLVPRSYSGFRESSDEYHDLWGTGEYQISLDIRESCSLTKTYKDNWRKNRRARKRAEKNYNVIQTAWQTVTSQQWDEITKSWVITILQAPADVLSDDLIDKLHLTAE